MTNKQLFKRLSSQQNRFIDKIGYSFHLSYFNQLENRPFYSISIHNKNHNVIYSKYFTIDDNDLTEKLQELKQFIDGLFNK